MSAVFAKFGLDANTQDFVGHAMALFRTDEYLNQPCGDAIKRVKLYASSLSKYGKSPYLYPLYGLGELPQGFARLSAIYGGTYMLHKPIDKVEAKDDGMIYVTSEGETVKAKQVIGDPSYFPERCDKKGVLVRAICILSHPIPSTNDSNSCQLILPQKQIGRRHDIYICSVSAAHNVSSKGKWLAFVSTTAETNDPKSELEVAFKFLGPVEKKFIYTQDVFHPKDGLPADNIFVTKSYDATTHFETTCDDIISVYKQVTGKDFDFSACKRTIEDTIEG